MFSSTVRQPALRLKLPAYVFVYGEGTRPAKPRRSVSTDSVIGIDRIRAEGRELPGGCCNENVILWIVLTKHGRTGWRTRKDRDRDLLQQRLALLCLPCKDESILVQPRSDEQSILHLLVPSIVLYLMTMQIHSTHSTFLLPSLSEPSLRERVVRAEI